MPQVPRPALYAGLASIIRTMQRSTSRALLFGLAVSPLFYGFATAGQGIKKVAAPAPKIDFNRQIRPILAEHCWPCHGTDKAALEKTGGLRLDTFAGATADRGGYRALVPGSPAQSKMWERIAEKDPSMAMPPKTPTVSPLSVEKKRLIWEWIRQGGEYQAHWAFIPPSLPATPPVSNPAWVRNPIDSFVMRQLDVRGLKPEPEADRETLIRRATMTLTGLPPTIGEIDAFLKDAQPGAYERVVDRLLASPRYGEHQARYWMDAVRYADTHGLHIDNERSVFPYRDWVVRAFNKDLSYKDFLVWQLAGDLLPNPTTEQKIATGYIRMNPTTNEGGVIEAEFLAKNTFDRTDTTSTVFLGLTTACAKCHDHKYDPISQKDYYSLYAFFNSTADPILDGNLKLHGPVMRATLPEDEAKVAALEASVERIKKEGSFEEASKWALAWDQKLPTDLKWEVSGPYQGKDFNDAFDQDFKPENWRPFKLPLDTPTAGVVGKENAAAYLRTTINAEKAQVIDLRLGSDDAIRVWQNGKIIHDNRASRGLTLNADLVKLALVPGTNELLIKIVNGVGPDGAAVGFGDGLQPLIEKATAIIAKPTRTTEETDFVVSTYLEKGPETELAKRYRAKIAEKNAFVEAIPMTYIAQEMEKPRPTFLLKRGEYTLPGDPVNRAIPGVFGKMPPKAPANRLGLAQWMIDPKNPLVSRVFVNRMWQQHFGTGLVKSSEDFGNRGDWPSHPELLDYLAVTFIKDKWSVKQLNRLIVTSAAFRQAATGSTIKRNKDPENKWISRGPRFRLDAEVIRDSALFDAGLLVEHPGGRGDKPYQPSGIWEAIAFDVSDTYIYTQDKGDALYRRSLYMFWKRTSPPPSMLIFDAPMRESCIVRRSRTNTPLQALTTMNDPQFFEAARVMAQRVLLTESDDQKRAVLAFRIATGRHPRPDEMQIMLAVLREQREIYARDAADAHAILSVGEFPRDPRLSLDEHAAWTLVCNMILNLDETLTQH